MKSPGPMNLPTAVGNSRSEACKGRDSDDIGCPSDPESIVAFMAYGERIIPHRIERAALETDRQLIVGDVALPPEGYNSRFSDLLNRSDLDFIRLTNVEITSLETGRLTESPFLAVDKAHLRIAFTV